MKILERGRGRCGTEEERVETAASGGWAAGDIGGAFGTTTVTIEAFLGGMGSVKSVNDEGDRERDKVGIVVAGIVYPVLKGLKVCSLTHNPARKRIRPRLLLGHAKPPNSDRRSYTRCLTLSYLFLLYISKPLPPLLSNTRKKLVQLELSSPITPTQFSNSHHKDDNEEELSLSKLRPNLRSSICNCGTGGEEVEWDWESPDWVSSEFGEGGLRFPSLTLALLLGRTTPIINESRKSGIYRYTRVGEVVRRAWGDASPPPTSSPTRPTYTTPTQARSLCSSNNSPVFSVNQQAERCASSGSTGSRVVLSFRYYAKVEVEVVNRETNIDFPTNTNTGADSDDGSTGPCEDRFVLTTGVREDEGEWGVCGGLEGG
ncbi:hypothetical protein PM082_018553 [Marasmius tenuissimus]|nr:hypothetical protein PM082_018553 [Marasmius tenuissimus]